MNYALHLQLTELLACTMELQLLMAIPFYLAAHGLASSQTRHQVEEQVTAQSHLHKALPSSSLLM
jgi:hypothetical protein